MSVKNSSDTIGNRVCLVQLKKYQFCWVIVNVGRMDCTYRLSRRSLKQIM